MVAKNYLSFFNKPTASSVEIRRVSLAALSRGFQSPIHEFDSASQIFQCSHATSGHACELSIAASLV
jgi:hypothetical protein